MLKNVLIHNIGFGYGSKNDSKLLDTLKPDSATLRQIYIENIKNQFAMT